MKIVRVQLDMPEDRIKEINELMEETNISTRKDFFNNALTLFEWAVEEKKKGRDIGSYDENQKYMEKIILPSLQNVKKV